MKDVLSGYANVFLFRPGFFLVDIWGPIRLILGEWLIYCVTYGFFFFILEV